jgi:prepilin-type N-terminal cleavage/methylation domain-containing protein
MVKINNNPSLEFSPLIKGKRLQVLQGFTLVELIVVITILAIL